MVMKNYLSLNQSIIYLVETQKTTSKRKMFDLP